MCAKTLIKTQDIASLLGNMETITDQQENSCNVAQQNKQTTTTD